MRGAWTKTTAGTSVRLCVTRAFFNIFGRPFAGTQSALYVFPDDDIVVSVISNTWGINAVSGEMATTLPQSVAAVCRNSRRSDAR